MLAYDMPRVKRRSLQIAQLIVSRPLSLIKTVAMLGWTNIVGGSKEVRIKVPFGKMIVIIPDRPSIYIAAFGEYEPDLSRALEETIKPGMTFVDVGAHYGYFTLYGGMLCGEGGTVVSFEPTPSTHSLLLRNIDLNDLKCHHIVENQAVSDKEGELTLLDYGTKFAAFNTVNSDNVRLPKHIVNKIGYQEVSVPVVTLDKYCEQNKIVPDVIKIDAEGNELEILIGSERILQMHRPALSLEVGGFGSDEEEQTEDILKFLGQFNYRAFVFSEVDEKFVSVTDMKNSTANKIFLSVSQKR